jgi:uncharacterized protein (TIGR03437 family)
MEINMMSNCLDFSRRRYLLFPILLLALSQGLMAEDDVELFQVEGKVTAIPASGTAGTWKLGGQSVVVTADTEIETELGPLELGACAEAEGTRNSGGSILALELRSKLASECNDDDSDEPLRLIGPITRLPADGLVGTWRIRNREVIVGEDTVVEQFAGPVRMGACVEVEGALDTLDVFLATEIRVRSSAGGCSVHSRQNRDDDEDDDDSEDDEDDDGFKFFGMLQQLPEDGQLGIWIVGGRDVAVTAETILNQDDGAFKLGACLEVEGEILSDSTIRAVKISVEEGKKCGKMGRPGPNDLVSFYGRVETIPESGLLGIWRIGSRSVIVDSSTDIDDDEGPIEVGTCVEVKGKATTGVLLAVKLESEDDDDCDEAAGFRFYGVVEELPPSGLLGTWLVAGRDVRVYPTTAIEQRQGDAILGACVEIHGSLLLDGAVDAARIEVKAASGACLIRKGIVNAASFADTAVAPGQIITIFGIGVGPQNPTFPNGEALLKAGAFPNALGGVKVYFDGELAPLIFVSQGQLNAMVPFSVEGKETVEMQVEYRGIWSPVITLKVAEAAPGVFTANQTGEGAGAILNFEGGNYILNKPTTPARRRQVVLIYLTGAGAMNPHLEDGEIVAPGRLAKPKLPVRVLIGGVEAPVQYAGSAPGLVSGLVQLNVMVPPNAPSGASVKVEVYVGGKKAQTDVTMSIAP